MAGTESIKHRGAPREHRGLDIHIMVLSLQSNDDGGGLTGAARRHRTDHTLLGKLACRRLAKLLPGLVTDNGTAAVVSFSLVEWLVTPFIRQELAASHLLIYANVLGWERMGVALDRALSKILDDTPRHAGVLRAQLRRAAEIDFEKGGAGTDAYVALATDYYVVADAFPTGADVDDIYDWTGLMVYKDLASADDTMKVYADLVPVLRERFDSGVALVKGGAFDRLAKTLTTSLGADATAEIIELGAVEMAEEMAVWLVRMLPVPEELAVMSPTRTSALLALRSVLVQSSSGNPLLITPANIMTVIQHHEAAKLVVGVNMGGIVALNMLVELLRLSMGTSVTSIALGQLSSGMAMLDDMLPTLRSERIAGLPARERLTYVATEMELWRQTDRTASRGSGGGSGGGVAAPLAEVATSGGVGYGAIYQQNLRRLLASEAYVAAADAVTSAMDNDEYGEAITIIFSAGYLPLIHALIGFRRSLPGHVLIDRIAEELRPLGPQWVADTLADVLLPTPKAPQTRKRVTALPTVWAAICKHRLDLIPWEKVCYGIIAESTELFSKS